MSGYKKGDKITVSLTCEISSVLDSGDLAVIHGDGRVGMVWKSALDSSTCTITRIDPPIKVGDRVRDRFGPNEGLVVAIHPDEPRVWWDWNGGYKVSHITDLERIA